mmetsp:Transcript_19792/g.36483  ORF Transcript_19792/g.36483 Transcript_19792/m.36483 type:complete len:120 (+) Transcript_19792:961-1320(+)
MGCSQNKVPEKRIQADPVITKLFVDNKREALEWQTIAQQSLARMMTSLQTFEDVCQEHEKSTTLIKPGYLHSETTPQFPAVKLAEFEKKIESLMAAQEQIEQDIRSTRDSLLKFKKILT